MIPGFRKFPDFQDLLVILGSFLGASVLGGGVGAAAILLGVSEGFSMLLSYSISMCGTIVFLIYYRNLRSSRVDSVAKPLFALHTKWMPLMLGAFVLMMATSVVLTPLLELFPQSWYDLMNKFVIKGTWTAITLIALAPIMEELLFRHLIQTPATEKYGAIKGILIAASVFGVIHFIPMQVINAFFLGIILGYVFYVTRSLFPVIILHALNNAIAYIATVYFDDSGNKTMREEFANDPLYFIVYGVALTLVVFGALYMWKNLRKNRA